MEQAVIRSIEAATGPGAKETSIDWFVRKIRSLLWTYRHTNKIR